MRITRTVATLFITVLLSGSACANPVPTATPPTPATPTLAPVPTTPTSNLSTPSALVVTDVPATPTLTPVPAAQAPAPTIEPPVSVTNNLSPVSSGNGTVTAPPSIIISIFGVINGKEYATPIHPVFVVVDKTDPNPTVTATLNGSTFISGTEVSPLGTYELVVTVVDASGNRAESRVNFSIVGSQPGADFDGDGDYQNGYKDSYFDGVFDFDY